MGPHDESDLPLRFHPLSNGEYAPQRRSELIDETVRRTLDVAETNARRRNIDRRNFLRGASGTAATLLALAACSSERRAASSTSATAAG